MLLFFVSNSTSPFFFFFLFALSPSPFTSWFFFFLYPCLQCLPTDSDGASELRSRKKHSGLCILQPHGFPGSCHCFCWFCHFTGLCVASVICSHSPPLVLPAWAARTSYRAHTPPYPKSARAPSQQKSVIHSSPHSCTEMQTHHLFLWPSLMSRSKRLLLLLFCQ